MNNFSNYPLYQPSAYNKAMQSAPSPCSTTSSMIPGTAQLQPQLPTGIPAGPSVGPIPGVPQMSTGEPISPTMLSAQYLQGYLRTQIGRQVRVEFLIGSSGPLVDRVGTLIGVGNSYILLQPINTDDILLCDLYSIRFVTFMY